MNKERIILLLIGIILFSMGAVPFIANFSPAVAAWVKNLPEAGSMAYQVFLAILGFIAIVNSLQKQKKGLPKELLKALGSK